MIDVSAVADQVHVQHLPAVLVTPNAIWKLKRCFFRDFMIVIIIMNDIYLKKQQLKMGRDRLIDKKRLCVCVCPYKKTECELDWERQRKKRLEHRN